MGLEMMASRIAITVTSQYKQEVTDVFMAVWPKRAAVLAPQVYSWPSLDKSAEW